MDWKGVRTEQRSQVGGVPKRLCEMWWWLFFLWGFFLVRFLFFGFFDTSSIWILPASPVRSSFTLGFLWPAVFCHWWFHVNPPFTFLLPRVVNHPPISLPVITVPQGVILGSVLCGSVPLSGKAWEAGSRAGVLVMGNPRWWPWEAKESRAEHCCCSYTLALLFWNQQRGMLVAVSFRPSCFSWQFWF